MAEIERIPVAEEVKELIQQNNKVLDINARIVECNTYLLDRLAQPPRFVTAAKFSPEDIKAFKGG